MRFSLIFYAVLPLNYAYAPVFYRFRCGFSNLWSVCSFSRYSQLNNAHKCGFCSFSMPFCLKIAHMLQFFTYLAVFFPDYGASAHFRGSSSSKMSINAVFAHFLAGSALKLRICSSFWQISLWFSNLWSVCLLSRLSLLKNAHKSILHVITAGLAM